MAEQEQAGDRGFRMPTTAHEFWALALALVVVLAIVQLGAPLIRELEFLDQKIRDYFIGISFAAFPLIHSQCKRGLGRLVAAPARADLTPWFASGAIAAALLFAWNQFVSLCTGFAIGMLHTQIPVGEIDPQAFLAALGTSLLAVSLPMNAVASVFAGILLNRYTRTHVIAALLLAAALYLVFNIGANYALQPEFIARQISDAVAGGVESLLLFLVGVGIVAAVVLIFGGLGVLISSLNRERSLGRIVDGARRLPLAERELLAQEISKRLDTLAAPAKP